MKLVSPRILATSVLALCIFILTACGANDEELVLDDFFHIQSHDEFVNLLFSEASGYVAHEGTEQEIQHLLEYLEMPSRPIADYLEDFDFLVEIIEYELELDMARHWSIARYGIENFYHVNDFTFQHLITATLAFVVFEPSYEHDLIELPFVVFSNILFEAMGEAGLLADFEGYIMSPNGTLVIMY